MFRVKFAELDASMFCCGPCRALISRLVRTCGMRFVVPFAHKPTGLFGHVRVQAEEGYRRVDETKAYPAQI